MAKDRVAKISVGFETRLAALEKGFKEAREKAKKAGSGIEQSFERAFAQAGKNLLKFGIGFLAVKGVAEGVKLAIEGVASAIEMSLDALGELDTNKKLADRIGINPSDLVGLQFGAELSGPGQEKLNSGLETLAQNLGLAAQGTGKAIKTLDQLGLSAKALTKLDATEQFDKIADAISRLKTPAEQVAATSRLFGDTELVNMLKEGSAGIKKMRDEAEALGITGPASFAAFAERALDAKTRFDFKMKAMKQEFSLALAPVFEALFNRLSQGKQGGTFETRTRALATMVAKIVEFLGKLGQAILKLIELFGQLFSELALMFKLKDVGNTAKALTDMLAFGTSIKFDGLSGDVEGILNEMFSKAGQNTKNRIATARFAADDGADAMGKGFGPLGAAVDVGSVAGISQFLANQRGTADVVTQLQALNQKQAAAVDYLRIAANAAAESARAALEAARQP